MEKIITKKNIEAVVLILFVLVFCYLGLANVWDKALSHNKPYAYLASDSFLHFSIAEYSLAEGRFKYSPPYDVGRHEGVLEMHPPFLPVLTIMLSQISGLQAYDSIYLVALIVTLSGILTFYILNRSYNLNAALLSLPVSLLIFSRMFNMMLFWGIWYFATGVALIAGAAYFILRIKEEHTNHTKYAFVFFGIIYGAAVIAHIPEAIYLAGFIAFYLIVESASLIIKMVKSKQFRLDNAIKSLLASSDKSDMPDKSDSSPKSLLGKSKYLFYGGVLGSLSALFYINVFRKTSLAVEGFRGTPADGYFGFPNIFITHLGIIGIIFLLGFAFHLLSKKRFSYPILFGLFFFGVSYLTYFGFGKRAFVHRFFWHVYLGIFFGIALFSIVRLFGFLIRKGSNEWSNASNEWSNAWSKVWNNAIPLITLVLFLIAIGIIARPLYAATKTGAGLMDDYNWNGLMWLRENVDEDTPVFYFYTDTFSQAAALYSSHHTSFKIGNKNLTEAIKSGRMYNRYNFALADSQFILACELGPFHLGNYRNTYRPDSPNYTNYTCQKGYKEQVRPPNSFWLCEIEYIYFNKFSHEQVLASYSMEVAKMLLKAPWIKPVYENELVLILHNERAGEECIEINPAG